MNGCRNKATGIAVLLLLVFSTLATIPWMAGTVRAGDWYDANYVYRQSVIINGTGTTAGTNYQINFTVHFGTGTSSGYTVYLNNHSKTDFSDLRFIGDDHTTVYDIWNETCYASDNATFWVEIPANLTDTTATMWVYYGYSSATAYSNGDNTFLFFDDFSGASINTTKWQNATGSASLSGGIMTLTVGGSDTSLISNVTTYSFPTSNVAVRTNSCITNDKYSGVGMCGGTYASKDHWVIITESLFGTNQPYVGASNGTNANAESNFAYTYQTFDIICNSSGNYYYQGGTQLAGSPITSRIPSYPMGVWYYAGWGGSGATVKGDWVFIRNYHYPEPVFATWTAEGTDSDANPPTFGSNSNNTYFALYPCILSIPVYDDTAPHYATVQTNNTGVNVNETWVAVPANGTTMNFTVTLNGTLGTVIAYQFFANDTSGNNASSSVYYLTMGTEAAAPTFGTATNTTPSVSSICTLSIPVYDNVAPKNATVQTNATGSNVNATWQSVSANGTTMAFSVSMPGTVGVVVAYTFFAQDYEGNAGTSTTSYLTTTAIANGTSVVLGNSSVTGTHEISGMRQQFYANGLNWIVWSNGSDTIYQSSANGLNWTDPTVIYSFSSGLLALWFNGTYVSLVTTNSTTLYRMGTPNANGTITWLADGQVIDGAPCVNYQIALDSNNNPWIAYQANNATFAGYLITSTTNNGTWTTKSGYPSTIVSGTDNRLYEVIPLTNGKFVLLYAKNAGVVTAKQWNGTAFLSTVATASSVQYYWKYDAVAMPDTDLVHVLIMTTGAHIIDTVYNATSNTFSAETDVVTSNISPNPIVGVEGDTDATVTVDPYTNNIYAFYLGLDNCSYYKTYFYANSSWATDPIKLSNETANGGWSKIFTADASVIQPTSDYQVGANGRIVIAYLVGQNGNVIPMYMTITFLTINGAPSDTTPPTFGTGTSNATVNGTECNFSIPVYDDVAPSYITVQTNISGVSANETWIPITSNGSTMSFTINLPATVGAYIVFKFFANDTAGNVGVSSEYNLTTTAASTTYNLSVPPFALTSADALSGGSWDSATLTLTFTCAGTAVNITNTGGYGYPASFGLYGSMGNALMSNDTLILTGLTAGEQTLCWMWSSGLQFLVNSTGTIYDVTYNDQNGQLTINGSGNMTVCSDNGFPGTFNVIVNGSLWNEGDTWWWETNGACVFIYNVPVGSIVVIDFLTPHEQNEGEGSGPQPPHDNSTIPPVNETVPPVQNSTEPQFIDPALQERFNTFANDTFTFVPESARPAALGVTIIGAPLLFLWLLLFLLGALGGKRGH